MATALGTADRTHRRRRVLADVFAVLTHTGRFQQSHEDLTPVFRDAYSLLPLVVVLMQLLISPRRAGPIAAKSINTYSLTAGAIRQILGV
jgi:hypothetical protein